MCNSQIYIIKRMVICAKCELSNNVNTTDLRQEVVCVNIKYKYHKINNI